MAYPPLAASRRPRRRATFAILFIITVIVGIVVLAVRFRTERRDAVDYLAAAKEVADEQQVLAGGLAELLATISELERPDILGRLGDLAFDSDTSVERLELVTVTSAIGETAGFFSVATAAWNKGLDALDDAVVEVLDGADDGRLGDRMLAVAFDDLRVGDRAYQLFRESLSDLDPELVTREYPDFGYTEGERADLYDANVISARLRAVLGLEENLDISVRATTDPEPLGTENGVRVVPDSDSFSVQIVVTNEGNVVAELITVSLQLFAAGGDEPEQRSELIAVLEPGAATTVSFPDLPVGPGVAYELRIRADVADDDVPDNNVWELIFIRNEP